MYQLMREQDLIAESTLPIVWTESELAWHVITPNASTYYCDPEKLMIVTNIPD